MLRVIEWIDRKREPKCAPDPDHPNGTDVDVSMGRKSCSVDIPYPAKRCGVYVVECSKCGQRIGLTTAGRPDDPRSLTVDCKETIQ